MKKRFLKSADSALYADGANFLTVIGLAMSRVTIKKCPWKQNVCFFGVVFYLFMYFTNVEIRAKLCTCQVSTSSVM